MTALSDYVLEVSVRQAKKNLANVRPDAERLGLDPALGYAAVAEVNCEIFAAAVNSAILMDADARPTLLRPRHDPGTKVP